MISPVRTTADDGVDGEAAPGPLTFQLPVDALVVLQGDLRHLAQLLSHAESHSGMVQDCAAAMRPAGPDGPLALGDRPEK
jgi:hypothetical protein